MSVTDFHTHILPGIDDGSRSAAESIAMLQREAEQGIRKVVASPHFYPHRESPQSFLAHRRQAEERLQNAMREITGLPEVLMGAEIYFFEGISDCEFLREMAITGTKCVMVEMPMKQWSDRNLQELAGIYYKLGLTPIVAHIDRYIRSFRNRKLPEQLAEMPVLLQANAEFFTGWSRPLALRLFARDQIHLLGSDCHGLNSRPPNMDLAVRTLRRACGEKALQKINRLEDQILAGHL